jgi:hypothetical protein
MDTSMEIRATKEGGTKEVHRHLHNHKRHNPDDPAFRKRNARGMLVREEYWVDGKRHSHEGAQRSKRNNAGLFVLEEYRVNGGQHNLADRIIMSFL